MKIDELYEVKVASYRDFRNHLLQCFWYYMIVVGALVKFSLDAKKENHLLFLALWIILVCFLLMALVLSFFYVRHAFMTARHVESLSKKIKLDGHAEVEVTDYSEDGIGMRAAMISFASLNGLALISSIVWLVMELRS